MKKKGNGIHFQYDNENDFHGSQRCLGLSSHSKAEQKLKKVDGRKVV